jgi:alpha-galactosidase
MRGHVAMSGNLGYELDLTKMTEEEQHDYYKEIRPLIQFGDFTDYLVRLKEMKQRGCLCLKIKRKPFLLILKC